MRCNDGEDGTDCIVCMGGMAGMDGVDGASDLVKSGNHTTSTKLIIVGGWGTSRCAELASPSRAE